MFERPKKTLKCSLFNVLENAQDYVADVCFEYPNNEKVYAHKAILLARAPETFKTKYLIPQLNSTTTLTTPNNEVLLPNISAVIPYTILRQLLRFWYIADFSLPTEEEQVSCDANPIIRQEIKQLENKLQVDLLSCTKLEGPCADNEQWAVDLKSMLDKHVETDVFVNIFTANSAAAASSQQQENNNSDTSFPAHRFMLASQSPYFYSVFCTEFREASTSSVHMPSDLFSPNVLQVILHYFYTETLIIPPLSSTLQQNSVRLNEKKHELRILQRLFTAADFLGHSDTICKAALLKMAVICHQFKCVCSDCSILLPSMLLFADKNEKQVPKLRSKLISLYADPLDSLATLWSQKPFSILVNSMQSNTNLTTAAKVIPGNQQGGGVKVISQILLNNNNDNSTTPVTTSLDSSSSATCITNLVHEITEKTFANITKQNSVRVLHSLHLCLSHIRSADPLPTWSLPTLNILKKQFLHHTVDMISNNFDYYCVEHPILLSCVDGIGYGFSVDFLGFVLAQVLTEGIHTKNAAIIYQGIIRDLGGRQEMARNVAVDGALFDARVKCAQYISKHWMEIRAEGGFQKIDKEVLRFLSEDINVPVRTLTKSPENDFSTIFSLKSKHKASSKINSKDTDTISSTASNNNSIITFTTTTTTNSASNNNKNPSSIVQNDDQQQQLRLGRARSLSASSSGAHPQNQQESILKKDNLHQSHYSDTEDLLPSFISIRRKNSSGGGGGVQNMANNNRIAYRRKGSTGSLTDALLHIDINTPIQKDELTEETPLPRPTRLRFALPDTPSRAYKLGGAGGVTSGGGNDITSNGSSSSLTSSIPKKKKRKSKSPGSKSRWSFGGGGNNSSDSSDDEKIVTTTTGINNSGGKKTLPSIGQKVELLRRPLPTLGSIAYVGEVDFAKGMWVGIELESRLGSNDGSVDGKRYFTTFTQRGVFVKIDDFKILPPPAEKK